MKNESEEYNAAEALTSLCGKSTGSAHSSDEPVPIAPMPRLPNTFTFTTAGATLNDQISQSQEQRGKMPSLCPNVQSSEESKKNFPEKLFEILENPEHSEILKWLPGGKAFIIMDKKRFAGEILSSYFKQTQFTSFTRKLSRWKFVRVPRGPFMGAYYHKLFRKDHKDLCKLMSCNNDGTNVTALAQARQRAQSVQDIREQPLPINHETNVVAIPQSRQRAQSFQGIQEHHDMRSRTMSESHGSNLMTSSEQNCLHNLEEMSRVASIKEQLLRLRLRRAQLYEQQKALIRRAQASNQLVRDTAAQGMSQNSYPVRRQQQFQPALMHPNTMRTREGNINAGKMVTVNAQDPQMIRLMQLRYNGNFQYPPQQSQTGQANIQGNRDLHNRSSGNKSWNSYRASAA
jgi:hypothetical protein